MSSEPLTPAVERPGCTPSDSLRGRVAAVCEVLLAFVLVHLAYRSFKHFTELGRLEVGAGLNFSPGAMMTLFTVAVLLLCRRDFARYGLTLENWRYNLNVGLLWAVIVVAAAASVVALTPVRLDPLRPPDLPRAVVFSLGQLALTLLLALFLRRQRGLLRRVPLTASLLVLALLLSSPLVLAVAFHRPVLGVLLTTLWLFFGAGFGEEVFFRGYIHSRINATFGRSFSLLGIGFGPGLIVSALLFGLIHGLNTFDYFGGRYDFRWLALLAGFCSGLFFGVLREGTGSVLAGCVVHGLEDVLGSVPALLP